MYWSHSVVKATGLSYIIPRPREKRTIFFRIYDSTYSKKLYVFVDLSIKRMHMQVFDCRYVTTTSGMFEALCNHIKYSTNKGNIR